MCDTQTYPNREQENGYDEYSETFVHFIKDLRKEFKAPELPFVIGVIGVSGDKAKGGIANLRIAMEAPAKMSEFKSSVRAVHTGKFWDHKMEELMPKKNKVKQILNVGHLIGKDGLIERLLEEGKGWELVGEPIHTNRKWKYTSFEAKNEKDKMELKQKKRFRSITLADQYKNWTSLQYDDSQWTEGLAPIGKGKWKHRDFPIPKYHSEWKDGEFLLMRTTFDVKNLEYENYRLCVFARQGFDIYLNGHKIHRYIWWRDDPHYRAIPLTDEHIQYLKKGKNVLAVYTNCEYNRKSKAPFGCVDVLLEGISKENLSYVKSEEYQLKLMDRYVTREEGKIIKGSSDGGYHYLGSGKMLSQIGEAFANAIYELNTLKKK
jgi:hypothetical protein